MVTPAIRFKVDKNLPDEAAELLRASGHEAVTVGSERLGGAGDALVAERVRAEARALVTLDLHFADVRAYPPDEYQGLVVLRLARQDKAHVLRVVERLLRLLEREPLTRRLWVVDEQTVRVRGEGR
jgi:predicted nuclease of predicted toxin-antitoxin system